MPRGYNNIELQIKIDTVMSEKTRYSDEELAEFRSIILMKN